MGERQADDGSREPEKVKGWERRSGGDRRQAERRDMEVPVERDRRSGWDRRQSGDRRKR